MNLSTKLSDNRQKITKILPVEQSFDIIERKLNIGGKSALLYFVDGFVKDEIMEKILAFLLKLTPDNMKNAANADAFIQNYVTYIETITESDLDNICTQILSGPCVLLIDGYDEAIIIDTRTYPARDTEEPEKERVMRGSRDGFVETVVMNTALIRRRIRDPKFVAEMITVGERSKTDVAICYIKDIANPKEVTEIKKKIASIKVKSLTMNQESLTECLIRQRWYNPFPKVRYTERPDVAAASILDGSIIVLVDNDPSAMLLPTSLLDFIQEPDDYYYPPVVGGYMRFVRNLIFISTLIVTPLWILILQNLNHLPPSLQFLGLSEANSIPVIIQLLILEIAVDVLRLASVNTPNMLGNSLSIIGALLLGDFAIKSGWFVPDTILYMAYIAIAGFAQPSIELNYAVKFMRILLLLITYFTGIWGFFAGIILVCIIIATNKTVTNKGYLYPLIPFNWKSLKEHILRERLKSEQKK